MESAWLKLHTNILDKRKIRTLPPKTFKDWIITLALCCRSGGMLPALADYAYDLHVSERRAQEIRKELTELKLLDEREGVWTPHDWEHWQYDGAAGERQKSAAAIRQQRFRDRIKAKRAGVTDNSNSNATHNITLRNEVTSLVTSLARAHTIDRIDKIITQEREDVTLRNDSNGRNEIESHQTADAVREIFEKVLARHKCNYFHAMKIQIICQHWVDAVGKRPDDPLAMANIIDIAHQAACSTDQWQGKYRESLDKWLARQGYMDQYPEPENDGYESAAVYLKRQESMRAAQGD